MVKAQQDKLCGMAARVSRCRTGDLGNNIDKLRHELQQSKYAGNIDVRAWRNGRPSDLLPLVHFALLGYSKHVQESLMAKGYDLFAKTDVRFLEAVYKLLRHEFGYQPQLRVEQFFAEGFIECKIILVHDVLKLCQRCHADLQRELKASQRDGVHALHSGSGLSSLATSTSQKSRPLVEKNQNIVPSAAINTRGSGGSLRAAVQQAQHQAVVYAEEDGEGLQPRAMRPPMPHPAISTQSAQVMSFDTLPAYRNMQGSAAAGGGYGAGYDQHMAVDAYQELELAYQELASKVEGLHVRMGQIEGQLSNAAAVDRRCANLEEEYGARLLLSEGRIRFLEKTIADMRDAQQGRARGPPSFVAPSGTVEKMPSPQKLGGGGVTGDASGGRRADGGDKDTRVEAAGGRLATATRLADPSSPTKAQRTRAPPDMPAAKQSLSYPGASAHAVSGGAGSLENISDEKLNVFISSIRERFRETHQLLQAGRT